jgi:hypothetical protein
MRKPDLFDMWVFHTAYHHFNDKSGASPVKPRHTAATPESRPPEKEQSEFDKRFNEFVDVKYKGLLTFMKTAGIALVMFGVNPLITLIIISVLWIILSQIYFWAGMLFFAVVLVSMISGIIGYCALDGIEKKYRKKRENIIKANAIADELLSENEKTEREKNLRIVDEKLSKLGTTAEKWMADKRQTLPGYYNELSDDKYDRCLYELFASFWDIDWNLIFE